MYVALKQLINELHRNISIQEYDIPQELIITGLEMLPIEFDPYRDTPKRDTLYLCEYWQFRLLDPHAKLPPLICVIEQNTDISPSFFFGKCMAVAYGTTLMELLLALTNAVYDLGCKSSLVTEVSRSLLACRDPQSLVNEGFRALKNPLIVTDFKQKVLYYINPERVSSPIYRGILADGYLPVGHPTPASSNASWNELDVPFLVAKGTEHLFPIICKPLTAGTATLGYLHILQLMHPFTEEDAAITELLGNLLSVELLRLRKNDRSGIEDGPVTLFRDILDDRLLEESAVEARRAALGVTLRPHLYAMIFNINFTEDFASANRIPFSELSVLVAGSIPHCHAFLYKNSVFAVLESDRAVTDFAPLLEPLKPAIEKYHLIVGISNEMPGIHLLREAGYMCRKAIQLGSALRPDTHVYEYKDFVIYYMIELSLKDEELLALCPEAFRTLIFYCKDNSPELLDTLRVYLLRGRNKAETAKELYVHVNTVKYRLTQIQEMTGLDISNDNTALELMLAFKMLEYREKCGGYQPIYNPD